MTPFDLINAAFEGAASAFILLNVRQVWRAKRADGVHWAAVGFFTAWGLWNLAYYPALGQWFSAAAGACVCVVNFVYLFLVWKYRSRRSSTPHTMRPTTRKHYVEPLKAHEVPDIKPNEIAL